MFQFLIAVFVVICFLLVIVVLMQSGKGGGLSGAFGGGGNQTVFGGRGAVDFLGKATWVLGSAYMVMALLLAVLSASDQGGGGSLIQKSDLPAPILPGSTPAGDALPGGLDLPTGDPATTDAPAEGLPTEGSGTETPATDAPAAGGTDEPGSQN